MKKLGIIIMIALALTVGGVYATFNYAQKDVDAKNAELSLAIAGKNTETAKGTIGVDTTGFMLRVDDVTGTLKTGYTAMGATKVTFTPAKGADDDVVTNGIKLKLVITINGTNKYNGTPIYKTKAAYTNGGVVLNGGNKVLGEISVNLADYLEVSEISLPTVAEYDAFVAVFEATTITVTVSEAK